MWVRHELLQCTGLILSHWTEQLRQQQSQSEANPVSTKCILTAVWSDCAPDRLFRLSHIHDGSFTCDFVILHLTELFIDVSITLKRLREIVEWNEPAANTHLPAGLVGVVSRALSCVLEEWLCRRPEGRRWKILVGYVYYSGDSGVFKALCVCIISIYLFLTHNNRQFSISHHALGSPRRAV